MIFEPIWAHYNAEEQYRRRLTEAAHQRLLKGLATGAPHQQRKTRTFLLLLVLLSYVGTF